MNRVLMVFLAIAFSGFGVRAGAQPVPSRELEIPDVTDLDLVGLIPAGPFGVDQNIVIPIKVSAAKIKYKEKDYELSSKMYDHIRIVTNNEPATNPGASSFYAMSEDETLRISFPEPGVYQLKLRFTLWPRNLVTPPAGGEFPTILVESRPFTVEVSLYEIFVSPASAKPYDVVSLKFSPPMADEIVKSASVTFSGVTAAVKDTGANLIEVYVPDLPAGSTPKMEVLSNNRRLIQPYSGFTVAAHGVASENAGTGVFFRGLKTVGDALVTTTVTLAVVFMFIAGGAAARRYLDRSGKAAAPLSILPVRSWEPERNPRKESTGNVGEVFPTPSPPPELSDACARGNCVLFTGAGVANQGGMPDFRDCLRRVIEAGRESKEGPGHDWRLPLQAIDGGDVITASDLIRNWLSESMLIELLNREFVREPGASDEIYDVLRKISFAGVLNWSWDEKIATEVVAKLPKRNDQPAVYLTSSDSTAFDMLLREQNVFLIDVNGRLEIGDAVSEESNSRSSQSVRDGLSVDEKSVGSSWKMTRPESVKGTIAMPVKAPKSSSFVFTAEDYRRKTAGNDWFAKFVDDCYINKSLFFVGASLSSIEEFLSGLKTRALHVSPIPKHFALVPRGTDFEINEALFLAKYGIRLIGYTPSPGYPQVIEFLRELRNQVEVAKDKGKTPIESERMPRLDSISLRNIGPFVSFDLPFHDEKTDENKTGGSSWNVLLGNNGCGKSTVLRSIALGLCGDDADARIAGAKLLRDKTQNGSITLKVGSQTYETTLRRESDGRVVVSSGLTPLQVGRWVALGFPALRGASQKNPSGAGAEGRGEPVVRDVLPLLQGVVDWRLDNLKQWIINVDNRINRVPKDPKDKVEKAARENSREMLDTFFDILGAFIPGVNCAFGGVDPKTFAVYVKTDDGLVPIDQLSQGTGSVLGWVGTLIQRLYEIHAAKPIPREEAALVLIDEVDAHMHPEWQQILVSTLKQKFPKLQVIATTHSALIVLNMGPGEVIKLTRVGRRPAIDAEVGEALKTIFDRQLVDIVPARRDAYIKKTIDDLRVSREEEIDGAKGTIRCEVVTEPLSGLTAAQALTGALDLPSAHDQKSATHYVIYTLIAVKNDRDEIDDRVLDVIAEDLRLRVRSDTPTDDARKARELLKTVYNGELKKKAENDSGKEKKLLDEVMIQVLEVTSESRAQK